LGDGGSGACSQINPGHWVGTYCTLKHPFGYNILADETISFQFLDDEMVYPPCDCDGNIEDCAGVCGGSTEIDECGVCGGNNFTCVGCTNSSACNYDNEAVFEDGSCEYAEENYDCDGNCIVEIDCEDVCGGSAVEDECGVCNGDNSTCTDCSGVINGSAVIDECGVCGGSGIPIGDCDCDGNQDLGCGCGEAGPSGCDNTCGSTLENDECGVCGGSGIPDGQCDCDGNVDLGCGCGEAGPSGCDNVCGSTAVIDECGICDGPGFDGYCNTITYGTGPQCSSIPFDWQCNGWLEAHLDYNTECEWIPFCNCFGSVNDCAGECGGNAELDVCGVCEGDGTSCLVWRSDCEWPITLNSGYSLIFFNITETPPGDFWRCGGNCLMDVLEDYEFGQQYVVYDANGTYNNILYDGWIPPSPWAQVIYVILAPELDGISIQFGSDGTNYDELGLFHFAITIDVDDNDWSALAGTLEENEFEQLVYVEPYYPTDVICGEPVCEQPPYEDSVYPCVHPCSYCPGQFIIGEDNNGN